MHVAGSAIDRVFNPPSAPARRFGGVIDTALALAVGSVCAFGLTMGPAPLNTVAVSAAAAAAFAGEHGPTPHGTALLPDDVESSDSDEADTLTDTDTGAEAPVASPEPETSAPSPTTTDRPATQRPTEAATPGDLPLPPAPTKEPVKAPEVPRPQAPANPVPSAHVPQAAALTIVEAYRMAAGLGAFVTAEACAQPSVYATVVVTPPLALPPGLAKKSLAPDPAYATVSGGPGAVTVTIHACQ